MTIIEHIATANALTVAALGPVAALVVLSALKLLRVFAARVNAYIRASRKPTWRADWSNDCPGVDVLGDGGRRLD